jgi:hypothetical protein
VGGGNASWKLPRSVWLCILVVYSFRHEGRAREAVRGQRATPWTPPLWSVCNKALFSLSLSPPPPHTHTHNTHTGCKQGGKGTQL